MPYRLPDRYRRNLHPVPFDDHAPIVGQCAGWEWQPDVYPYAAEYARTTGASTIVDVGCGAGRKLAPLADEFKIIGLDRPEIVQQITAPGEWLSVDLEAADVELPAPTDAVFVCSDVIEHLLHPENAMLAMRAALNGVLILSTPDRSRSNWTRTQGPPLNRGHVQEWTLPELAAWCEDLGYVVVEAEHTRSNDHEPDLATCLLTLAAK